MAGQGPLLGQVGVDATDRVVLNAGHRAGPVQNDGDVGVVVVDWPLQSYFLLFIVPKVRGSCEVGAPWCVRSG